MAQAKYKRVIIKLSGEALAGKQKFGIEQQILNSISRQVKEILAHHVEVAMVVGGGNIWRGVTGSERGIDRAPADYMGMLATVINALALQDTLKNMMLIHGFFRQLKCGKLLNPILNEEQFDIWKKVGWLFLLLVPVIPFLQQIPRRL